MQSPWNVGYLEEYMAPNLKVFGECCMTVNKQATFSVTPPLKVRPPWTVRMLYVTRVTSSGNKTGLQASPTGFANG